MQSPHASISSGDSSMEGQSTGPISVFLVEDEQLIALDLKRRLERFGYQVLGVAGNGEEALAYLRIATPDVILMDVHLQGEKDGISVAEQLKDRSSAAVIFVTGNADEATLQRAQATCPFNYILKPVRDRELSITIDAAVQQQRLKNAIRSANQTLEHRVNERTADLTRANRMLQAQVAEQVRLQNELRHTQSIMEASRRSRAHFFGNLSHEIRTPINGILGVSDMLAETGLDTTQRKFLSTMKDCSLSLLDTVDSLILFAEIEAGRVAASESAFQLRSLMRKVFSDLSDRFQLTDQQLTCDIAPQLPDTLIGDAQLLEAALFRLLTYVLQISRGGEVALQMEQVAEESGRVYLHLSIRNSGPDLSEEERNSVARTFAHTRPAERQFEQVPVHLSIASSLIQLLQGLVWLDAIPGVGNAFNVALWVKRPG